MTTDLPLQSPAPFAQSPPSSEALLQAAYLLGDNPVFIVGWKTRRILACNDAVLHVFGYTPSELVGGTTRRLHISDETFEKFGKQSEEYIAQGHKNYTCQFHMRRRDGSHFATENLVQTIYEGDVPVAVVSVVRDMSRSRDVPNGSAGRTEPTISALPRDIPGAVFQRVRDTEGRDRYTYLAGELLEKHRIDTEAVYRDPQALFDLIVPDDRSAFEQAVSATADSLSGIDMVLRFQPPESAMVWLRVISRPQRRDDGSTVWDGIAIDVTREVEAQAQAHWLATHDSLTGLVNRVEFTRRLEERCAAARQHRLPVTVVQVNVRGMSRLNEQFGFDNGDRVLSALAERIEELSGADNLAARSQGDVFQLVFTEQGFAADGDAMARSLQESLGEPILLADGTQVRVEVALGIARFPEDGKTADQLIQAVSLATDKARKDPAIDYAYYSDELSAQARKHFHIERALRDAVAESTIEPYYQPQVSLDDHRLVGLEALARWPLEGGDMVSPADFIPVAETSGMINSLGRLMLSRVTRQIQAWNEQGLSPPPIAVNCSAHQFRAGNFDDVYKQLVLDSGLAASAVRLELTETSLVDDFAATERTMHALDELGVKFSIDDFGTGFSSLSYLAKLPFGELKIDRSFVMDMMTSELQQSIVAALIQIARALNLSVIAEGIETIEQEAELRRLGCVSGQGFLYSKALHHSEVEQWLSKTTPSA
ncbi:MAG: EAL domain-containing protein [Halofilum sp. (in: g-proteobacteria)]|nr:EAL domain-containing protein [Halofilum sp. (in: g-proteobacteria)]